MPFNNPKKTYQKAEHFTYTFYTYTEDPGMYTLEVEVHDQTKNGL